MFTNLSDGTKTALQVVFVLALVGGAIALLLSMGVFNSSPGSHLVSFEVKASGGYALITLKAGSEHIDKPATVTVPWSKTIRIKSGTEIYLTASNPSQTGELSCRITLDKEEWKSEKISAPKNGVACAGIVP
ncbi:MAG: hypothetical protein U0V02_16120 [Anaerolineales bacterium]